MTGYSEALKHFAEPSPDLFLERARLQAALGKFDAAVSGLDEGISRLGPAPALERAVIEYERQRGEFEQALARTDKMAARAAVKEPVLVLRAELLEQVGRLEDAATAFQQSLEGIEKYSISRRSVEATQHLEKRSRQGLARVRAKLDPL